MTQRSPFRCFRTSPEIIRLAVMMYVRFPFSLRNVEDLLHERGRSARVAPSRRDQSGVESVSRSCEGNTITGATRLTLEVTLACAAEGTSDRTSCVTP